MPQKKDTNKGIIDKLIADRKKWISSIETNNAAVEYHKNQIATGLNNINLSTGRVVQIEETLEAMGVDLKGLDEEAKKGKE